MNVVVNTRSINQYLHKLTMEEVDRVERLCQRLSGFIASERDFALLVFILLTIDSVELRPLNRRFYEYWDKLKGGHSIVYIMTDVKELMALLQKLE